MPTPLVRILIIYFKQLLIDPHHRQNLALVSLVYFPILVLLFVYIPIIDGIEKYIKNGRHN